METSVRDVLNERDVATLEAASRTLHDVRPEWDRPWRTAGCTSCASLSRRVSEAEESARSSAARAARAEAQAAVARAEAALWRARAREAEAHVAGETLEEVAEGCTQSKPGDTAASGTHRAQRALLSRLAATQRSAAAHAAAAAAAQEALRAVMASNDFCTQHPEPLSHSLPSPGPVGDFSTRAAVLADAVALAVGPRPVEVLDASALELETASGLTGATLDSVLARVADRVRVAAARERQEGS